VCYHPVVLCNVTGVMCCDGAMYVTMSPVHVVMMFCVDAMNVLCDMM